MDESIIYIAAVALAFVLIFMNSKKIKALRRGGSTAVLTTEAAQKYHGRLAGRFRAYDNLSFDDRKKFLQRLHDFIEAKTFVGHGQFQISEEIKIFIAAQVVQLTFRLKHYALVAYDTVYVFDTSFAPSPEKAMAEAAQKGRIAFSWPDFKIAMAKQQTFHAGIYQIAHALEMSSLSGKENRAFKKQLMEWKSANEAGANTLRSSRDFDWNGFDPQYLTRDFPLVAGLFFGAPEQLSQKFPEVARSFNLLIQQ